MQSVHDCSETCKKVPTYPHLTISTVVDQEQDSPMMIFRISYLVSRFASQSIGMSAAKR